MEPTATTMNNCVGIILVCLMFVQPAFAQAPDPLPARPMTMGNSWWVIPPVVDPDERSERELERWVQEYMAWQEWAEKWLNRPQWVLHPFPYPFWKDSPSLFSYVASTRVKPDPPMWLEATCVQWASSAADSDPLVEGCQLLTDWKDDDPTHRIRAQISLSRAREDKPSRTALYEHIHFASLWTTPQTQAAPGALGLAGIHATIDIQGRWQIYPFPGVMAVSVPNRQGERIISIGYDWGFAIRLFDFRVPFLDLPAKAHLNVVEIWVPEVEQKISMVGLSFTLKKPQQ
jgi:hypothetical protein